MNAHELALRAARAAARLRADQRVGPADAVCPYDLAHQLGIVVRLTQLPSLEGVYAPDPKPTILISTERPAGRRRYTCGHEIGHHVFGHGTRLDELAEAGATLQDPEELVAQRFAAALLLPKLAVESAFARRGWAISTSGAEAFFVVAQDLGVGYATLVGHLERTLGDVSVSQADRLRQVRLPRLRSELAGFQMDEDLVVFDEHWGRRPIDIEVDDIVLVPKRSVFSGSCATFSPEPSPHLRATASGVGQMVLGSKEIPVRVSRRRFAGLARYRHLEEEGDG